LYKMTDSEPKTMARVQLPELLDVKVTKHNVRLTGNNRRRSQDSTLLIHTDGTNQIGARTNVKLQQIERSDIAINSANAAIFAGVFAPRDG
jgi:hypothetical protein